MNEYEQPSYYAIIPANVRYDKSLRANEKLLYGEITSLANKYGYCWASNKYFSELYGVTPQAISKWINNLNKRGYLSIEYTYKQGSKEIDKRIIKIVSTNVLEVSTNDLGVSTNVLEVSTNDLGGYQQMFKENNTSINNKTINNKKEKSAKHKRGEYAHVLLTDIEYDRLINDYGQEATSAMIKKLDEYIETTGKRYKNHNLVIRGWVKDWYEKEYYETPSILKVKEEPKETPPELRAELERRIKELKAQQIGVNK